MIYVEAAAALLVLVVACAITGYLCWEKGQTDGYRRGSGDAFVRWQNAQRRDSEATWYPPPREGDR
jgi:hypothetical protein